MIVVFLVICYSDENQTCSVIDLQTVFSAAWRKNDTRFYKLPKMHHYAPQIIIIPSIWGVSVGLFKPYNTT